MENPEYRLWHSDRKIGEEVINYIKKYYLIKSDALIAKELGLTERNIVYYRNSLGLSKPKRAVYNAELYTKKQVAKVIEDFVLTGDSFDKIGKRHEVSRITVSKWIEKHWLFKKPTLQTVMIRLESRMND